MINFCRNLLLVIVEIGGEVAGAYMYKHMYVLTRAKDPGYDTCKPFACCYAKT